METQEWITLAIVFAAVGFLVFAFVPIIRQAGSKYERGDRRRDEDTRNLPIYRFTTPERLERDQWSFALLAGGFAAAGLLAGGVVNHWILGIGTFAVGILAFFVPAVWVKAKIRARQREFEESLMDITLGLASGLRAGVALPQAMDSIVKQLKGPAREELGLVLREHTLGKELPDALANLNKRMPGEDLYLLTTAVRLTMQSGGSLAEVLEKISATIRDRREFQQKLKTMTEQGRFEAVAMALAPMAAFLLILLVDKQLMMPLLTEPLGWAAIGVVLVLEAIGFVVINKIVSVKV